MKRLQSRTLVFAVAAMAVLAFTQVTAQAGMWTQPSGSALDFDYSNGQDLQGKFGDPMVMGNELWFVGVNFQANAGTPGASASDSDQVSFDMNIHPGLSLSYVTVTAYGSYSVLGAGSSVDVTADLSIDEIGGQNRTWDADLLTTPGFPLGSSGPAQTGGWTGVADLDLSYFLQPTHDVLHVELANLLEAVAGETAGAAEINQQFQNIVLDFVFVPEPTTLVLLGFAGFALLRKRR